MQVLAGPAEALANLVMRRFTLEPGGRIPAHRHPDLEHGQLVLDGELVLSLDGARSTVRAGDVVTIPAGVAHWYENRSASPARFLCVIPNVKDYRTEWLEES
jgi:quercetin dioxygenase-like cupin family protein